MSPMLSPRQQSVLNRVVDIYIDTAQPVGSRQITEIYKEVYNHSYSSATVRHEMGVLEGLGYLTHPHTSAGRTPTDRGYRYYVDHSMQEDSPSQAIFQDAAEKLAPSLGAVEDLGEKISEILSKLSAQVSVVLVPDENRKRTRAFVQGASSLLDQPEFQAPHSVQPLLKIFENRENLQACLPPSNQSGPFSIAIGEENSNQALKQCSVVASRYFMNSGRSGMLALIGPRRMKYSRMVPLIVRMGKLVENLLQSGRLL